MGWTKGHVLGRGSSATVSAATSAVLSQSSTLQREKKFLSILSSPYVVTYKGCEITKEDNKFMYNLMIKYMPQGTVIDAIKGRNNGRFNESEISNYTRQIVQGLKYLHSYGIVHCDIKCANILVDNNGVKIADFGCAKWVNESVLICGTPMFMAPEVARGEEQGFAADIWALGCAVIEMANCGSPWLNVTDPITVLYKIGFSGELPEIPSVFSHKAKDFISKCLIRDPKARWGATELLTHPFLDQFDGDTKQIIGQDQDCCSTGSPTSILDRDVWSSIEESASVGADLIEPTCSPYSLRQRVEQLVGNSEKVNWRLEFEEEVNWMTIRSSGAVAGDEMVVDCTMNGGELFIKSLD